MALRGARQYFGYVALFSAAINLLMLVPIIYMLQVYDRVISSGSLPTLSMLTLLLVALLLAMGGFEWVRSRILIACSNRIERILRRRVSEASLRRSLSFGGSNAQAYADLTGLRQFMTGNGLFALFDAPWFPIYIAVMFLFHPWFGVAGLIAGSIMVCLAFVNEAVSSKRLQEANALSNQISLDIAGNLRFADVIYAMGMENNIRQRQEGQFDEVLNLQTEASRRSGMLANISKTFRITVQSLILGLGAFLALRQEITPGMMIAGSLLLGRALAPVDQLVNNWKGFAIARAQYDRLDQLLAAIPAELNHMSLPAPLGNLSAEQIVVVPPGAKLPSIRGVSMQLEAGEVLGIVGPSASGKSSLARALLGIWPTLSGKVRLDGAEIQGWDREELGVYIGYLPQEIGLLDGKISENICRFGAIDSERIVSAAKLAGVHELILRLPQGYDTEIRNQGYSFSGGQRQRIALARAMYGEPKVLVLDEPNSNLDELGERELIAAIQRIRARHCTVILITHRASILQTVDRIMVMREGQIAALGPRDRVLAELKVPVPVPSNPMAKTATESV